jgi:hypothetical protein
LTDNTEYKVKFHDVGFTTPAVSLHITGNAAVGSTQQIKQHVLKKLPFLFP